MVVALKSPAEVEETRLMRQWLHACLVQFSWVSVPTTDEQGNSDYMIFQVLTTERRTKYLKTFRSSGEADPDDALYNVTAQFVERWRGTSGDCLPKGLEMFVFNDPEIVDILSLCSGGRNRRHEWLVWTPEESDLEGCIALRAPQPMTPKMSLSSPSVPVLALVDALEESDYIGLEELVVHSAESGKVYDQRRLSSSRNYLQCVLAGPQFAVAVSSFPSGRPAAYYELLLRGKKAVDKKLTGKECRRQLAALKGDALTLALLDKPAPPPAKPKDRGAKRKQLEPEPRPLEDESDDSVAGDESDKEDIAPEPAAAAQPALADDNADDEVAGDEAEAGALLQADFPKEILGCSVRRVAGRCDGTWSYEDRLAVKCPN